MRNISEDTQKELKGRFGKLGLYLIEKASEEIKKMNRIAITQKATIKKRYFEKKKESSLKLQNQFMDSYNQILNNTLTSTLLNIKQKVLYLKSELIKKVRANLYNLINQKIQANYSTYLIFLSNLFKEQINNIDRPPKILLLFNEKDYDYFKQNADKIKELFTNPVELRKNKIAIIGGFKAILSEGKISYDYTISNLIEKNSIIIENEISQIISDLDIRNIENKFENIFQNQKLGIEEHLKEYERI